MRDSIDDIEDPGEVTLQDQFDDSAVDVEELETKLFCNPVDKNEEGRNILDVEPTHLTGYKIKIENEDSEDRQLVISNQFGEQTVLVKESELMFVPSIKTFVDSVATEAGDLLGVNHFKCHKADGFDDIADLGENEGDPVSLDDQFSDGEPYENIEVKKALLFCNPAVKNHEGETPITNEAAHLTCYEIAGDDDTVERIVDLDNQFGDDQSLLVKEYQLLCVPSAKISVRPDPDDNDNID